MFAQQILHFLLVINLTEIGAINEAIDVVKVKLQITF